MHALYNWPVRFGKCLWPWCAGMSYNPLCWVACYCCMVVPLYVIACQLFASRVAVNMHDMDVPSWLNAEALKWAPTPHFSRLARCFFARQCYYHVMKGWMDGWINTLKLAINSCLEAWVMPHEDNHYPRSCVISWDALTMSHWTCNRAKPCNSPVEPCSSQARVLSWFCQVDYL